MFPDKADKQVVSCHPHPHPPQCNQPDRPLLPENQTENEYN